MLDQRVDTLSLASQAAFEQIAQQPLTSSVGPRYQQTNGDLQLVVRQQAKWSGGDWHEVRTVVRARFRRS